jgi:hypothetical protein
METLNNKEGDVYMLPESIDTDFARPLHVADADKPRG